MASKQAMAGPQHTAGIFADMTVDGPEIGTLVLIFDRAKNLPNRKSMGKQNPYCAARLGKEAKKTDVDKRGGQTPRWDQEIRFTVHDSPDYYTLKISLFSEDKKTELIGEAWIRLNDVVVPGGGKNDLWQQLNFKGKYAGELRLEMTYYDTRPKPENLRASVSAAEETRPGDSSNVRVKRRPLPVNPNKPDPFAEPVAARTRHGPRDLQSNARAMSMPPEASQPSPYQQSFGGQSSPMHPHYYGSSPQAQMDSSPMGYQYYGEPDIYQDSPHDDPFQQPDFLPQLPPSSRQRAIPQSRQASRQMPIAPVPQRPMMHSGLPHSHSAPIIPTHPEEVDFDEEYHLHTDYPEAIPDLDYQHSQIGARRMSNLPQEYHDPYAMQQHYIEEEDSPPPPPPPMHSNSAPAVPQFSSPHGHPQTSPTATRFGATPPSARQQHISHTSPLQSIERTYATPQRIPVGGRLSQGGPPESYHSSPNHSGYNSPAGMAANQTPSPAARASAGRALPQPQAQDPYNTPPRPHPLSQQVSRARSPNPYSSPATQEQMGYRDGTPLIKPRAVSPRPAQESNTPGSRPRSSYDIQFPVRSFESGDGSPLSLSSSQPAPRASPMGNPGTIRKSVSPSTVLRGGSGVPFGPDSFDVHNPNARESHISQHASPRSPWQIRGDAENQPQQKGPIVGWHGNEIDPSDHLPVDSWAPEPAKKTPTKTYGLGRDRDFGPRTSQGVPSSNGRMSRDVMVNVRMKADAASTPDHHLSPEHSPTSANRNRLTKKSPYSRSPSAAPLRERDNFNSVPSPYANNESYSPGFHNGAPPSPFSPNSPYGSNFGGSAPHLPPKVPHDNYGPDALSREIGSIDLGPGPGRHVRQQSVPAPMAYVPSPTRGRGQRNSYY